MLMRDSGHPGADPRTIGSDRGSGAGARRLPDPGSTPRRTALASPPGRILTLINPTRPPATLPVGFLPRVGNRMGQLDGREGLVGHAVVVLVVAAVVAVLLVLLPVVVLIGGWYSLLSLWLLLLLLLVRWHCCLRCGCCSVAIA